MLSKRGHWYCDAIEARGSTVDLDACSHALLHDAVTKSLSEFKKCWDRADESQKHALKAFLQQPLLGCAKTWKLVFGATPPRGVLARIARRVGVQLHESLRKHNYISLAAFKREIRRMRKWYMPGRKTSRYRRGILRSVRASSRVRGLRSVWSVKVASHYKRLLKPLRLEGLWRWRQIALALHHAGVEVQSGTIPVERVWASLKDMLPRSSRMISVTWFKLFAGLAFLRFNYRHFHQRLLPSWTECDSLLAERVDNLVAAAQALSQEDDQSLSALFGPFV